MRGSQIYPRVPLKRLASVMPSNIDKHSVEGERQIRLCNYVDVYRNERIHDNLDFMQATATDSQVERFTLRAQDVIVTKDSEASNDIGVPAFVSHDMPGVVCGYHLAILRPYSPLIVGGYLAWVLRSREVQGHYETAATGISRYALGIDDLGMTPVPLPSKEAQVRIANFLDEQTARIDALIAESERLLCGAQEIFRAKLGHAVVAGMNGRGTLVSAEKHGFAQVRSDWRLIPLKYLVKSSGGMTPSKERLEYWDGQIPWASPKDMKQFVLEDAQDHVTQLALEETSLKLQSANSVLIVVRGMILAHTFPVALNAVPVTINQDMKALVPNRRMTSKYLAWMLRGLGSLILSLTEESAHGTKALRTDQWESQRVPVPDLDEQEELVRMFEEQELRTLTLCDQLRKYTESLQEYRSSLISAAVTGQIDINNFQMEAV